jgi:nucleoside-diphosphate-sugar epimerase
MIAGASGFIGAHLARACSAAGHEVIRGGRHPPEGMPGARHLPLGPEVKNLPILAVLLLLRHLDHRR